MKMIQSLPVVAAFVLAVSTLPSFAADTGKEITLTGNAVCAKCVLHETKECQNVIQTEKDGKTVNYYLVANDVSKEFHGKLCKESKKVTATGTVKEVDGKLQLTASKIELAEKE